MTSLHERYVTIRRPDGSEQRLLALDPSRVEQVEFIQYRPPPIDNADRASIDEWIERASLIEEDLHWLLELPHDRFWCQIIFDTSLHRCIDSYLREAPRSHDPVAVLPQQRALPVEVIERMSTLQRLFFLTLLRASTHHESATDRIDPAVFGDIIYENYVFDVMRLMDICAVYGQGSDTALIAKMIGNIFTQQPKYTKDLGTVVSAMHQVFDSICIKCGIAIETDAQSPVKLCDSASSKKNPLLTMTVADLEDLVMYISDIAHTLHTFLKLYQPGAVAFWEDHSFPARLATVYEQYTTAFDAAFQNRIWPDKEQLTSVKRQFRRAQVCLLRTFRLIVYHMCLRPIVDKLADDSTACNGVEDYLDLMGTILNEKRFLAHLHALFPFAGDREILNRSSYLVDDTRLDYIEHAFMDAITRHGRSMQRRHIEPEINITQEASYPRDFEFEGADNEYVGATAGKIPDADIDAMVSSVRDLLPDLGRGFVRLCLEEYGNDCERLINALLEDKLLPSLQGIDRSLDEIYPTTTTPTITPSSMLKERSNVYDGDEFDVFSHSAVDESRIHKGKHRDKEMPSKLTPEIRASYAQYAYQVVDDADEAEATGDVENLFVYDDEYDDTYDSNIVGAGDADSADEMLARRPFVTPRIFASSNASSRGQYAESDDENDEEQAPGKPRDVFLEDPAKLRQQREERMAAKRQQQDARKHTPAVARPPQSHDVKGGPRGQGQSADVLKNRAWKEKNKASRVHHNRKDLADRKRRV